jgi:hypothetical protein
MPISDKARTILSSVYAGVGLGLLMGLIMGLSISPTVKIVIGTLAGLLGGLLGLENKLGKSDVSENTNVAKNVKIGSFGFAVVVGILFGITIRTHDLFAPPLTERVQSWIDAGYDSASARKYVVYEKLRIDPVTGKPTSETDDLQRKNISGLFNHSSNQALSTQLDTVLFNGDMQVAIEKLKKAGNPALDDLLVSASEILPEQDHMMFITLLQQMTYKTEEEGENYCQLPQDTIEWNSELLRKLSNLLLDVDYQLRNTLVKKIKEFFCTVGPI